MSHFIKDFRLKKIILFLFFMLLNISPAMAQVTIITTNIVQKMFVENIGASHVNVSSIIPIGANPHTYSPKPKQMLEVAHAKVYFMLDSEFDTVWLPKFKALNKNMLIENMAKGVQMIEYDSDSDHAHSHNVHESHALHEEMDPHVWMSPAAVKVMAKNIYDVLISIDSAHAGDYTQNYQRFSNQIDQTDKQIRHLLSNVKEGTKFMVFHPAFGYFAKEYHLKQVAVEFEGKKPKPKMLMHIIQEAKEEHIKTIITSPEFSDKAAKVIAKETGASIVKISPLSIHWSKNLILLAQTIADDK